MTAFCTEDQLLQKALCVPHQTIGLPGSERRNIQIILRRDDLIDSDVPGNKFYKLFFNLQSFRRSGASRLVTQGGPWSNHLLATAQLARREGIQCKAFVRGYQGASLTDTLKECQLLGMTLEFVGKQAYQSLEPESINSKQDYFLPEGGSNNLALKGSAFIGKAVQTKVPDATALCVAVGTGGTFAGIARGLASSRGLSAATKCIGFPVLTPTKGRTRLFGLDTISSCRWALVWGFHLGGYARKIPEKVVKFWRDFEIQNAIELDPVYTLKLMWGINQLAEAGYWQPGSKVVAVHSGGLQGRRGFSNQIDWKCDSQSDEVVALNGK